MALADADRPKSMGTDHRRTRRAVFSGTGILVAITFLTLVGVGAIVSLATGSWWALAAAVVVHGLATIAFLFVFVPVLDRDGGGDPAAGASSDRSSPRRRRRAAPGAYPGRAKTVSAPRNRRGSCVRRVVPPATRSVGRPSGHRFVASAAFDRRLVLAVAVLVLALHPVLQAIRAPLYVLGPLDWSAHLATAVVLLANAPIALRARVVVGALLASVVIDLDHVPGYLGWDGLAQGLPRPFPHSLATPLLVLGGAALLERRHRPVALGVALGLLAHLFRDLSTGDGVALLWPLSGAAVRVPFWLEAAALAALATRAWLSARTLPAVRPKQPGGRRRVSSSTPPRVM